MLHWLYITTTGTTSHKESKAQAVCESRKVVPPPPATRPHPHFRVTSYERVAVGTLGRISEPMDPGPLIGKEEGQQAPVRKVPHEGHLQREEAKGIEEQD